MLDVMESIIGFIIGTVVLKGIIAHAMADYIVKYARKWLISKPHRMAYFDNIVTYHKEKSGTV